MKNSIGDHSFLEIGSEHLTIREFLKQLPAMSRKEIMNTNLDHEIKKGRPSVQLLVNGKDLRQLPKGMDTELKEGDTVSFFPQMAGG